MTRFLGVLYRLISNLLGQIFNLGPAAGLLDPPVHNPFHLEFRFPIQLDWVWADLLSVIGVFPLFRFEQMCYRDDRVDLVTWREVKLICEVVNLAFNEE